MNEAIRIAIEKGRYWNEAMFYDGGSSYHHELIVLDPLFWQSLGKALGWGNSELWLNSDPLPYWKLNAMNYFDLLLTSGDTEKFWEELLTTNK